MGEGIVTGQPPSPPHSTDGGFSQSGDNRSVMGGGVKQELFTPPMAASSTPSEMSPQQVFDPYGDPSMYHTAPTHPCYTPQHTMITSAPSQFHPQGVSKGGILTRSGRTIGTPSSAADTGSTRCSPTPRARKNLKKRANSRKGSPVINQPLSILTKGYKTPVRDMAAWVNRPFEDRMAEVDRKKGYIARPMNSFMMYRSAYADRAKQFCKENNHQIVSQVTGASWPLEPKEVRDYYEQLAILERDNHAACHPTYKFAPNKSGKRTRNDVDDSDSDPEWEGTPKSSKRGRSVRRFDSRSASSTPFEEQPSRYNRPMPQLHLSGYDMHNPYGYGPMMVGPNGMMGDYIQSTSAMGPYDQNTEIQFQRLDNPFPSYHTARGLEELPNARHHELLTSYPDPDAMRWSVQNDMLDPRLGEMDNNYQVVYFDGGMEATQELPRTISYEPVSQLEMADQSDIYHPGLATLTEEHDVWGASGQVGSDFDSEFQNLS